MDFWFVVVDVGVALLFRLLLFGLLLSGALFGLLLWVWPDVWLVVSWTCDLLFGLLPQTHTPC